MRVREEVDDGVRAGERGRQGDLVEDVSFDGTGPDALEQPPATRGPRTPATRWPAASSSRTARRPTTPEAPVITMSFMTG